MTSAGKRLIEVVQEAMASDQKIFLLTQKDVEVENPGEVYFYRVGTVATVKQIIKLPKQILRVLAPAEEAGGFKYNRICRSVSSVNIDHLGRT